MANTKGPTEGQLAAAIEGAKHMPEAPRSLADDRETRPHSRVDGPETSGSPGPTPGLAEGERDPSEQSR